MTAECVPDTSRQVFPVKHNQLPFLQDQEIHPGCFLLKALRRLPSLAVQPTSVICSPAAGPAMWENLTAVGNSPF